jgi:hypothetical protein
MDRLEAWKEDVVQCARETRGLDLRPGVLISGSKVPRVAELLARHSSPDGAAPEVVLAAAIQLAVELFDLGPTRAMFGLRLRAEVAARSAGAELNRHGLGLHATEIERLAAALIQQARHPQGPELLIAVVAGRARSRLSEVAEVYLSLPGPTHRQPSLEGDIDAYKGAIEEGLHVGGTEIGMRLVLATPGQPARDSAELLSGCRSGLRHAVLHLVLGCCGGTTGTGREAQGSIERRRPIVWLVPPGDDAPRSVDVAALEAHVEILHFTDADDLRRKIADAVVRYTHPMHQLQAEKDLFPDWLLKLHFLLRRQFMRLELSNELLAAVRMHPGRLSALLADPYVLYHEASLAELDVLGDLLSVDVAALRDELRRGDGGWRHAS